MAHQPIPTPHPYTVAYTDGSSTGRVGPGGWAWATSGPDDLPSGVEASGGAHDTTNQRMELQAAHEAVKALPGLLLVVSDSAYVVNCFLQSWHVGWHRRNWAKVKNRDLWEPFVADVLARRGEVRFQWIKGHSSDPMNDHVDALAKAARLAITPTPTGAPL
jgi:ribonuclease HI